MFHVLYFDQKIEGRDRLVKCHQLIYIKDVHIVSILYL